jgi:hypothetical protein
MSTTITKKVPVATHYAACDSPNQLRYIDSTYQIDPILSFKDYPFDPIFAPAAYDCCVAAIEGGYAFSAYGVENINVPCRLFRADDQGTACSFDGTTEPFYVTPNSSMSIPYILSNGYCGSWVYAGVKQ